MGRMPESYVSKTRASVVRIRGFNRWYCFWQAFDLRDHSSQSGWRRMGTALLRTPWDYEECHVQSTHVRPVHSKILDSGPIGTKGRARDSLYSSSICCTSATGAISGADSADSLPAALFLGRPLEFSKRVAPPVGQRSTTVELSVDGVLGYDTFRSDTGLYQGLGEWCLYTIRP